MKRLSAIACLLATVGGGIRAQAAPRGGSAKPPTVAPTVVEEAQASFRAGVDAYSAGDYQAALEEFERAYRLAPTYKILFNLAQVAYQRRDYVLASRYFNRYLDEGGDLIEPARRAEVERELVRLRMRIGELEIVGAEAGSDVFVDDIRVGIMPMSAPVAATVGRRRIEVVEISGRRQVRQVDVTAGGRLRVSFAGSSEVPAAVPPPPPPPPPPPQSPSPPLALRATPPRGPVLVPGAMVDAAQGREPSQAAEAVPTVHDAASPRPSSSASWKPWAAWGLTAVAATGAILAGRQALATSNELQRALGDYPVTRERLDGLRDDERGWALTTDAALLATAILGAIAIYVTTARTATPTPSEP